MTHFIRPFDGHGKDRIAAGWGTNALGHRRCDRKGCHRLTATPMQWSGGDLWVWRYGWAESRLADGQHTVAEVARRIKALPTRAERAEAWADYNREARRGTHLPQQAGAGAGRETEVPRPAA